MYKKINGISPNVYNVSKENVVEDITFQAAGLAVPGLWVWWVWGEKKTFICNLHSVIGYNVTVFSLQF